jgi:hypothetical protein
MSRPWLRLTGIILSNIIEAHGFMKDGNQTMTLTTKKIHGGYR